MSGGGGGAGVPRMLSRMNWPRFTGEVRVGLEVTSKIDGMRQHAAARAVLGQRDLAHLVARHALDAVILGELGVEERVIAVDQLEQAAVLAGDVVEEPSRSRCRMARRRSRVIDVRSRRA